MVMTLGSSSARAAARPRNTNARAHFSFIRPSSGLGAAHVDERAVARVGVGVDVAGDELALADRQDDAILRVARGAGEAEIDFAVAALLQPQLMRRGIVGDMHEHAVG